MTEKCYKMNRKRKSSYKHDWTNDIDQNEKENIQPKFFPWLIWLWNLRKEIVANLDKLSPATVHYTLFGDCEQPFRMNHMKNWVSNQRITFEMKHFAFSSCVQFFFLWIRCIWNRRRLRFLQHEIHLERIMSNEHENEKYVKYSMRYKSCLKDGIRQDKVHVYCILFCEECKKSKVFCIASKRFTQFIHMTKHAQRQVNDAIKRKREKDRARKVFYMIYDHWLVQSSVALFLRSYPKCIL